MAGQQVLVTNSLGGYTTAPRLAKKMWEFAKPLYRFRQFCDFKEAWGKHKGDTVLFDRYSKVSTAGGTLVETSTIPSHNIVVGQGTITIRPTLRRIAA